MLLGCASFGCACAYVLPLRRSPSIEQLTNLSKSTGWEGKKTTFWGKELACACCRDRLEQLERKRERERKLREQQKEQREQKERERRAEERRKEREARREGAPAGGVLQRPRAVGRGGPVSSGWGCTPGATMCLALDSVSVSGAPAAHRGEHRPEGVIPGPF